MPPKCGPASVVTSRHPSGLVLAAILAAQLIAFIVFGRGVLVQIAKGLGDNGLRRIAKLNGILYLPDVGSKTTSFSSAFAGIFASN